MNNPWLMEMGVSEEDAMRIARELLERSPRAKKGVARLNWCRNIIVAGSRELEESRCSVTLRKAMEVSLQEREERRPSTVQELRWIFRRFMKRASGFAGMKLRNIRASHCKEALDKLFDTPQQFRKGRIVLHSVFACGIRHGWCSSNPVDGVLKPRVQEAEITALTLEQIEKLLREAQEPEHRECAAVLGLMLWAGVRPTEAQRLSWEDINWEEGAILLPARHSKTGGARCITLQPVLREWLLGCGGAEQTGAIRPQDWHARWRRLRREADIGEWQQDVLRHTFASYHLKHFRNLSQLQLEMGHSTLALLRTRYLNMRGISQDQARLFWSPEFAQKTTSTTK